MSTHSSFQRLSKRAASSTNLPAMLPGILPSVSNSRRTDMSRVAIFSPSVPRCFLSGATRVFLCALLLLSALVARARGGILDYYEIETIALPEGAKNVDGIAFLPDGRLVCCFHAGQVYIYDVSAKKWTLFADGLHMPLGVLPLSDTEILVMQIPELTRLRDTNGDGRADEFETVSDAFGLSGNYAEFAFGPVKDAEGNLFFGLGTG